LITCKRGQKNSLKIQAADVHELEVGVKYAFHAAHRSNIYIANLFKGDCNCPDYKKNEMPCKHMFFALRFCGLTIRDLPLRVKQAPHLALDYEAAERFAYVTPKGVLKTEFFRSGAATPTPADNDMESPNEDAAHTHVHFGGGMKTHHTTEVGDGVACDTAQARRAQQQQDEQALVVIKRKFDVLRGEMNTQMNHMFAHKKRGSMQAAVGKLSVLVGELQRADGGVPTDMQDNKDRKHYKRRLNRACKQQKYNRKADLKETGWTNQGAGPGRLSKKKPGLEYTAAGKRAMEEAEAKVESIKRVRRKKKGTERKQEAARRKRTTKPSTPEASNPPGHAHRMPFVYAKGR